MRLSRQAVLLCGGKGVRMLWKTEDRIPKSLLPVNGKELLSYTIDLLPYPTIETLVFAVGHHQDQIRSWVNSQGLPHTVLFVPDDVIGGGTYSALRNAVPLLNDGAIVIANTDEIRDGLEIDRMLAHHKQACVDGTILAAYADNLHRHRVLNVQDGMVISSILKPQDHVPTDRALVNAGLQIVQRDALLTSEWVAGSHVDHLVGIRQLQAYVEPGLRYINVGTKDEYTEAITLGE